jgi:AraC-like DNA-binding protein/quercetin dioxygenase-like cupin family protein
MAGFAKNITDKCTIPKTCRERFLPILPDVADEGMTNPLTGAGIFFAGISDLVPGYRISRRNPDFHLVIFGVGGTGVFETYDMSGEIHPGDIWLCPAGKAQRYWVDGSWKILFFHIDAANPALKGGFDQIRLGLSRSMAQLENAMIWLINEDQSESSHSRQLYFHHAAVIRLCLERELQGLAEPRKTRTDKKLDGLWQEVSESLAMPWTLSELARRMHLSVGQLRRVVQANHGLAPMEMVHHLRIQKAQQLLKTTGDSLEQIAERVGYTSPFSFSRAFKKSTGFSPKAWRGRFRY